MMPALTAAQAQCRRIAAHLASSGHPVQAVRLRGMAAQLTTAPRPRVLLDRILALCEDDAIATAQILGCAPTAWGRKLGMLRTTCRRARAELPTRG